MDKYEQEMIDAVNRHAEEQSHYASTQETPSRAKVMGRGLGRMLLAVLTAVLFAISLYGFIMVASVPGYRAVLLFHVSGMNLFWAFALLHAQGKNRQANTESQGDGNA